MVNREKPLSDIWWQHDAPILFNRGEGKRPWVKTTASATDVEFIKLGPTIPLWIEKYSCYQVPMLWFSKLVRLLVENFGQLYVIQPYREKEICSPSCKNAMGYDCSCQCYGQYHGVQFAGNDWFVVSEACEVRWGEKSWGCRLLSLKPG